jgi:DNA-directed RNA polymerase specialized sigma24 family protein
MQHETSVQIRQRFEQEAPLLVSRLKIFFRRRCTNSEEATRVDDWVQETMLRVARKVEDGLEIANFNAYAMGTAKVVFREYLSRPSEKSLNSQSDINGRSLETLSNLDTESDVEIRGICLDECLLKLDEHSRTMIASWFGISGVTKQEGAAGSSTARVRVFRLVNRLRACCRKCMEEKSRLFGVRE